MKILFFHTELAPEQHNEAWQNMLWHKEQWEIIPCLTTIKDDASYWAALEPFWFHANEDLILIEQDVLFDGEMLESLKTCNHLACSYYFKNSSAYTPHTLSIGARISDPEAEIMFDADTPQDQVPTYVTFSGVGLCKIDHRLQRRPLDRFTVKTKANGLNGLNADNAIIQNVNHWMQPEQAGSLTFHVHGKVKHTHH